MDNIVNIDKLPQDVRQKFVPYLKSMLELHKGKIISVFIYGSAAGASYVAKSSDINSAFIFRDLNFADLEKSLKIIHAGKKNKITAPLFLTKEYIDSSLDIFPIEFLDMKENHVLLFGEDILSQLKIKGEYIRLFCEQQIKGKLIRIRQSYLEVGLNPKELRALLKTSLNTLMPVFRNLIRLKGKHPPTHKPEIIHELCQAFQLNPEIFLAIYQDITKEEKIAQQQLSVIFENFINEMKKLAGEVDHLS